MDGENKSDLRPAVVQGAFGFSFKNLGARLLFKLSSFDWVLHS